MRMCVVAAIFVKITVYALQFKPSKSPIQHNSQLNKRLQSRIEEGCKISSLSNARYLMMQQQRGGSGA